jgi:hypothetical protein
MVKDLATCVILALFNVVFIDILPDLLVPNVNLHKNKENRNYSKDNVNKNKDITTMLQRRVGERRGGEGWPGKTLLAQTKLLAPQQYYLKGKERERWGGDGNSSIQTLSKNLPPKSGSIFYSLPTHSFSLLFLPPPSLWSSIRKTSKIVWFLQET